LIFNIQLLLDIIRGQPEDAVLFFPNTLVKERESDRLDS